MIRDSAFCKAGVGSIANAEDITNPKRIRRIRGPSVSIKRLTALAQNSNVSRKPISKGKITEKSRCPMPSAIGWYKPRKMRIDEELSPGKIMLNAQIEPENRYQPQFGWILLTVPPDSSWKNRYDSAREMTNPVQLVSLL